jgi:hypothetical protein
LHFENFAFLIKSKNFHLFGKLGTTLLNSYFRSTIDDNVMVPLLCFHQLLIG